jgi:hypothetical protein
MPVLWEGGQVHHSRATEQGNAMADYSMNCPVCGTVITADTVLELGWNYSDHMKTHKK